MAKNVLVLKNFESPKEEGTYFRLMCLTGELKGEAYILSGSRIVLGRSETADIKVMDIKSSREHAEITKVGTNYIVTDLGSQNGILVNGLKVKQKELTEADKIVIGQTVYKFTKLEVKSNRPQPVQDKFKDKEDEAPKRSLSPLLGLIIFGAIILMVFDSNETQVVQEKKRKTASRVKDVNDELLENIKRKQMAEDKNQKVKINAIFQRGLREYREKNYFRAINEFNLALILNPNDPLADFYLRKTKEELDRTIDQYFIKGKREEDSLRYQGSLIAYCAIVRLLVNYPEDSRYKNAIELIKATEGKLGLEEGETSCIKKQPTGN